MECVMEKSNHNNLMDKHIKWWFVVAIWCMKWCNIWNEDNL